MGLSRSMVRGRGGYGSIPNEAETRKRFGFRPLSGDRKAALTVDEVSVDFRNDLKTAVVPIQTQVRPRQKSTTTCTNKRSHPRLRTRMPCLPRRETPASCRARRTQTYLKGKSSIVASKAQVVADRHLWLHGRNNLSRQKQGGARAWRREGKSEIIGQTSNRYTAVPGG